MEEIMHEGTLQKPANLAAHVANITSHVARREESGPHHSVHVTAKDPVTITAHDTRVGTKDHSRPKEENTKPINTWAERVRISYSDPTMRKRLEKLCDPVIDDAEIEVPEGMIDEEQSTWRRCLVGFTPGQRLPYHAVRLWAFKAWERFGLEEVTSVDGYFLYRFRNEECHDSVLALGPWLFGGKVMLLQQWNPHMTFNMNRIDVVPVWIRLYGLPFPFWNEKGLSYVASLIGTPIACDTATANHSRLQFARICVELDAARDYLTHLKLKCKLSKDPIFVKIEYEWKPKRCSKCFVYGNICPLNEKKPSKIDKGKREVVEKIWKPKVSTMVATERGLRIMDLGGSFAGESSKAEVGAIQHGTPLENKEDILRGSKGEAVYLNGPGKGEHGDGHIEQKEVHGDTPTACMGSFTCVGRTNGHDDDCGGELDVTGPSRYINKEKEHACDSIRDQMQNEGYMVDSGR